MRERSVYIMASRRNGTLYVGATDAIIREKQLKPGSRVKKIALIEALNRSCRDLYEELA